MFLDYLFFSFFFLGVVDASERKLEKKVDLLKMFISMTQLLMCVNVVWVCLVFAGYVVGFCVRVCTASQKRVKQSSIYLRLLSMAENFFYI